MEIRLTVWNAQGGSEVSEHESVEAAKQSMIDTWNDPENLTARIETIPENEQEEPRILEAWNGSDWYKNY